MYIDYVYIFILYSFLFIENDRIVRVEFNIECDYFREKKNS